MTQVLCVYRLNFKTMTVVECIASGIVQNFNYWLYFEYMFKYNSHTIRTNSLQHTRNDLSAVFSLFFLQYLLLLGMEESNNKFIVLYVLPYYCCNSCLLLFSIISYTIFESLDDNRSLSRGEYGTGI